MKRSSLARSIIVGAVLTAFLALPGGVVLEPAARAATSVSSSQLKAQAIYAQQDGDIGQRDLVVDTLAARSPWQGTLWRGFLTTWASTNNRLKINSTVPKGLPTTGHVFVVLGSALTKSGQLSAKLERRLKLALSALQKYPKSKVLVSGGATRNGQTEAGVMSKWLIAKGIAKSRILVENKSSSTVSNATKSMALLSKSSTVTSYTLITDSSHMRRASILFAAATVGVQEQSGKAWPIKPVSNIAHMDMPEAGRKPLSASSIAYTASNVASVFKVSPEYKAVLASPPRAAVLTSLKVAAPADLTYTVGQRPNDGKVAVKAIYNGGVYTRVVTGSVKITGFNSTKVGERKATAAYTDGKVTKTASFAYSVVKAVSKAGVSLSTTKVKRAHTRVVVKAKVTTAASGVKPTGKVRVYLDGKRLKTVTLSKTGTVTYKLPRLLKLGQREIAVKYSGDARLKSAATRIKITVKR